MTTKDQKPDPIEEAIRFISENVGMAARILAAHHRLPNGLRRVQHENPHPLAAPRCRDGPYDNGRNEHFLTNVSSRVTSKSGQGSPMGQAFAHPRSQSGR
jgi:hypothetical protein